MISYEKAIEANATALEGGLVSMATERNMVKN